MSNSKAQILTVIALLLGAGIGWAGSQGSAAFGTVPLFALGGIIIYLVHWLAGFGFEVTADRQKTRFRADHKDRFISSGLWSISRPAGTLSSLIQERIRDF